MELCERFEGLQKIGFGSFSRVYKAWDTLNNEFVALKVSDMSRSEYLLKEGEILKLLPSHSYFPEMKWFGQRRGECALAMSLLGPSLQEINEKKTLEPRKIYRYMKYAVQALEILHSKGYVHLDIKPANICTRNKDQKSIVLIDFGITSLYLNPETGKHIDNKLNVKFRGNFAFCSENVIHGMTPSRRDDLESLCYVCIFLLKNELPWLSKNNTYRQIIDIRNTSFNSLVENIPNEIVSVLSYCKSLDFKQVPNYSLIYQALGDCRLKSKNLFHSEVVIIKKKAKKHKKRRSMIQKLGKTLAAELPEITEDIKLKCRKFLQEQDSMEKTVVMI